MNVKGLSIIAIVCLGAIITIDFTSFKLPVIAEGTGAKSEELIHALSLSYLASYRINVKTCGLGINLSQSE